MVIYKGGRMNGSSNKLSFIFGLQNPLQNSLNTSFILFIFNTTNKTFIVSEYNARLSTGDYSSTNHAVRAEQDFPILIVLVELCKIFYLLLLWNYSPYIFLPFYTIMQHLHLNLVSSNIHRNVHRKMLCGTGFGQCDYFGSSLCSFTLEFLMFREI